MIESAQTILTSSEKFHICLGLERVSKALEIFENPQDELEFIHVAGTNGKGSTCAILSAILCEEFAQKNGFAGKKIGFFSSPHLFSYTERIKINNVDIGQEKLDELTNLVNFAAKEHGIELTEFEILTVVAFLYFKNEGAELVVLETGLGGRLDCTNIIKRPLVSIITSIGLDHIQRLGDSIEQIGFEKAGIIKENCPVVISKENLAYDVICEIAAKKNSKIITTKNEIKIEFDGVNNFAFINEKPYPFPLLGDFQKENLSLAFAALEVLPFEISQNTIYEGLKNIRWKFRMEFDHRQSLLIDGCHNPSGAAALREFLDKYKNKAHTPYKIKFIYGSLNNKDYEKILEILVQQEDDLYFYEFNNKNCLKYEDLPQKFKNKAIKADNPIAEIGNIEKDTLTVVCGSFYMLGELFS